MKRILKHIIFGVVMATAFSSCLFDSYEATTPTYQEEQATLKAYLDTLTANGRDIDTTALGVYYITLEEGEGPLAKTGDTLTIGYAGYFVNGTIFESSEWYSQEGKTKFILGETDMIDGWNDAMKTLSKNAKVQFIIPSDLAYGSTGSGSIPPYTTLVFVVKLWEFKPVN